VSAHAIASRHGHRLADRGKVAGHQRTVRYENLLGDNFGQKALDPGRRAAANGDAPSYGAVHLLTASTTLR
jgi:hypothetical protein